MIQELRTGTDCPRHSVSGLRGDTLFMYKDVFISKIMHIMASGRLVTENSAFFDLRYSEENQP